jgi:hypothetical protein
LRWACSIANTGPIGLHPCATNTEPYGSGYDAIAAEQGAMGGVVGDGDSTDLVHRGVGVIQTADQIIDSATRGIDQKQQRSTGSRLQAHPLVPVLRSTVKVWKVVAVELYALQFDSGEVEQHDAQRRALLHFMGITGRRRAHDTSAETSQPVAGVQTLLKQGQQAREITGEVTGHEHQGDVSAVGPKGGGHIPNGLLHGWLMGEGMAATRLGTRTPEPVERIKRNHELDLTNPVVLMDGTDNEALMCLAGA